MTFVGWGSSLGMIMPCREASIMAPLHAATAAGVSCTLS